MSTNNSESTNTQSCQTAVMRSIRVYSNPIDERLDYTKEYVFHHWIDKRTALIEMVENGYLMEVIYEGTFNFKVG
jgi:hypothetical protein